MRIKSQADIISIVLVFLISISLVGTAYFWGIPLIQKKQDATKINRLFNYFDENNVNSLNRKIQFIASNGGEDTFTIDINGLWVVRQWDYVEVENNSIQLTTTSRVTNIDSAAGWVSLTTGATCSSAGISPLIGSLGVDASSVVCAKADSIADLFNVTYRLYFRELDSADSSTGYKINLIKWSTGSPPSSSGDTLRIARGETSKQQVGSKTLTLVEIKILLE